MLKKNTTTKTLSKVKGTRDNSKKISIAKYIFITLFVTLTGLILWNQDFFNKETLHTEISNQNPQWGVLAINTPKEIYTPGEDIDISISALDQAGQMVCDAQVVLKVTNRRTKEEVILSTVSEEIKTNSICSSHTFTLESDYYSTLILEEEGIYDLELSATTENGEYTVTDQIEVKDSVRYSIEKIIPTRIYPIFEYPVIIKVTPKYNYRGKVTQIVPADYIITELSSEEICKYTECENASIEKDNTISSTDNSQQIKWNVNWEAGETYVLSYKFDAPDNSPEFNVLGPLNIGLWQENQPWQIAVDTAYDDVVLATNGGPDYRLKLDGDLVEDIGGITVTGAPNSYVSTIIPLDSGYSGEYAGAQETVLANQTDVNSSITYRKSVSFWVIIDTFGTGTGADSRIIWEEGGATNWWSAYTSNGDELRISIGESGNDVGNCMVADLSTDSVYHVVMQWEASTETMELWLDGVLECSTTTSTGAALSSHTGDWEIGYASDAYDHTSTRIGGYFDGRIGDYAYWAEPIDLLTQSEIEAIYTAGYNLPPSPTLNDVPFKNEKTGDSTPDFEFTGSDPDGSADLIYQIQVDDDYLFASPLINCESDTTCTVGAGSFVNTETGGDTSPFNEDELIRFTPTTTMTTATTYYWRVRVEGDVSSGGAGIYGNWSAKRSVTYVSGTTPSSWFQTTDEQFDAGTHVKTLTSGSDSVVLDSGTFPYIVTESGTMSFAAGDSAVTYDLASPVGSQSKSFILVWGTGVDQDIERVKFTAKFNDDSQIQISRGESGTAAKAAWQVVQANDYAATPAFTVQTGEISIISTATTGNATITDVSDTDQATVIVQASCGSSDDTRQVQFRGYLSTTTQVNVARITSGSACTVRYWVVKWAASINVYNGQTANNTTTNTASIGGTIDRARSVLFMNWDNDTNGLSQHATRGYLNSTTQITFNRQTSTGTNNVNWSVVEFPSQVVVRADNGTSSPTLGTTATTVNTTISSVTQANSFILHSQDVSGTGSAIVRGQTIAYLTSSTNITFEKLYTGQTSYFSYYVADFSGWTFASSTGNLTSTTIDFDWMPDGSDWDELKFNDLETSSDIKYDVLYWDGDSWEATSIVNQDTSPVDISSLSPTTHNQIRIMAKLTDSGASPILYDWEVTWTTSSNSVPTVSGVSVNGGSTISLTEGTTVSVSWTSTVTDADGYSDFSSVLGVLYRSGVSGAEACSANQNNCYADSVCDLSGCSGSSCTATCTVNVQFFAQPTDSSSPYPTEYWRGWVEATDSYTETGEAWSATGSPDLETMAAMSVTSVINYDPLLPGDDTGASNETTTVTNTGNTILDLEVSGDNFCTDYPTCSGPQIAVGYQEFYTSTFTYGLGTPLESSPMTVQIDLAKSTSNPANSSTSIYWGMGVPNPKEEGSYSGANTVFAVDGD